MQLFEVAPTIHWSNNTKSQATAEIKTADHTFTLSVKCVKFSADHVVGWLDKVIDHQDDIDTGRIIDLSHKSNHSSTDGSAAIFDKAINALQQYKRDHDIQYYLLFSKSQSIKEMNEKFAKKLAKKIEWSAYQDKNYILIHRPTLDIHQVD